jgi:hypothetical protein
MGKTLRFDDENYANNDKKYKKKHSHNKHSIFEEKINKKISKKGKKILKKIKNRIWPFVDEKNKGHHKV